MVVPVVADADSLFGGTTRGLLIYLDDKGRIRLLWSPLIPDESGPAANRIRSAGASAS